MNTNIIYKIHSVYALPGTAAMIKSVAYTQSEHVVPSEPAGDRLELHSLCAPRP